MGAVDAVTATAPGIALRVTVRASDLETFIDRYSKHIDGDRIFIFTKSPQPVGTRVRFTLQLASGEQLIHGKGTVTRVQPEGNPRRPSGMELVFVALDDRSQTLVDFMLATRATEAPPIVRAVVAPPKPPPLPVLPPPAPSAPPDPAKATSPEAATASATASATARATEAAPPAEDAGAPDETATAAEPRDPGPAPAFAEKWHDALPAGTPAAGVEGNVPANPFSEVSDGAIEYFVEWALEQSIGARTEPTARFSDVAMALPGSEATGERRAARRWTAIAAGCFVLGLVGGAASVRLMRAPVPALASLPTTAPPSPSPPPPPPAPPAAPPPAQVELVVITRPPGARVQIDGVAAGVTPLTAHVGPGAHELTLAKERYASQTLTEQAPGHVQLALKRPLATLRVASTPPGAQVTVDGTLRGRTPAELRLPAYERYSVEVTQAGARPWRRAVYVRAPSSNVAATLALAARPKPGARPLSR